MNLPRIIILLTLTPCSTKATCFILYFKNKNKKKEDNFFAELKNSRQDSVSPKKDDGAFKKSPKPRKRGRTEVNVENRNVVRPPPPITIDNVIQSNRLQMKLQGITKQKSRGRIVGKGLRVYLETPEAYPAIRRYIDTEKLEAFTSELNEEKDLKAVIRPSDTPPQEIIEDLLNHSQRVPCYDQ
ncbi:hypothetical protein TNCV_4853661 [Trichonephila clavipes]|nr:hypothetical protein TNCV_4853661 [Trichonephila clavipes]